MKIKLIILIVCIVAKSNAQVADLCYIFKGKVTKIVDNKYSINVLKVNSDSTFNLYLGMYSTKELKKANVLSSSRQYYGRWKVEADSLVLLVQTPNDYKGAVFKYLVKRNRIIQLPHEKALRDKELLKVVKFYSWKKLADCGKFIENTYYKN